MELAFDRLRNEYVKQIVTFFEELKKEDAGVSFVDYCDENKVKEWIDSDENIVFIALREDRVVGVIKGRRDMSEEKRHSVFLTCAVLKGYRRENIAKKLTEYSFSEFKNLGVKILRAYIYSDNKPSINTILSCGFTFSGCVHMHHLCEKSGEFVDDLIFHKLLN